MLCTTTTTTATTDMTCVCQFWYVTIWSWVAMQGYRISRFYPPNGFKGWETWRSGIWSEPVSITKSIYDRCMHDIYHILFHLIFISYYLLFFCKRKVFSHARYPIAKVWKKKCRFSISSSQSSHNPFFLPHQPFTAYTPSPTTSQS